MNEPTWEVSQDDLKKFAGIIQRIAAGKVTEPEPITSFEMAQIFQCPHMRIFNRITRFLTTEATDEEKSEFQTASREYRRCRKHPIFKLTEKGCRLYIERLCSEEKRSRAFIEGLERFNSEIALRYHGYAADPQKTVLMQGRSRTECGYIKDLFDRFVTGPAIEGREIKELGTKYDEFFQVLRKTVRSSSDKSDLEDAMMGVAVEAEMQGFIYGFKVFEILMNRAIAIA